jgi:mannose-6-phosphate isomerase-like protein (cupin superfamily)
MIAPRVARVNEGVPLGGTALLTRASRRPYSDRMPITAGSLLDDQGWKPMPVDQQDNPSYYWEDGRLLADAPVDFRATFDGAMWVASSKRLPIGVGAFNRNPLRVRPNFVVPRHHHNIDETVFVFKGEYTIEYGDADNPDIVKVGPGGYFTSRAGTPYTMTASAEGVTYIETWGVPLVKLKTVWYDVGWVRR